MIIRSSNQRASGGAVVAAWLAIESIQKTKNPVEKLVLQADHAHLSGAVAAAFDRSRLPEITDDVVEAIRLHDEGWAQFEGTPASPCEPATDRAGRPISFVDAEPDTFLKAWKGSIAAAAAVSATGHYIVSSHFRKLAEHRLASVVDPPETTAQLQHFAAREAERQRELFNDTGRTVQELEYAVEALRFCDLVSLAICSGVTVSVEFSHDFGLGPIQMSRHEGEFRMLPCPLEKPVRVGFSELLFASRPLRTQRTEALLS